VHFTHVSAELGYCELMNTQTIMGEIKGLCGNLEFPARKDEVVEHAQQHNASPETVQTLEQMPDQKYNGIEDLLAKIPGVGNIETEIEKFI
jgi:hypothetical protein